MKALFFTFKWLIVPGVIGVTGFFIIGPFIGTVPELDDRARPLAEMLNPNLASPDEADEGVDEPTEPSAIVEATGQKADHRRRQRPSVRVLSEGQSSGGSSSSDDENDDDSRTPL